MPDLRSSVNTLLAASIPLTSPGVVAANLTSWLVDRPLAPKGYTRGWEEAGVASAGAKVGTVVALTALEVGVNRVVSALRDNQPRFTPAAAIAIVVAALSKATAPLCLAALATLGDE